MSTYAYMAGQNEKLRETFLKMGIEEENIFEETESGSGAAYRRMLKQIEEGDMLYLQSLDALGMNMNEICAQWCALTKERGIDVAVTASPLIDTRIGKEMNGSLVADVTAEILLYAAREKNNKRRMRQKNGIARAQKKGVHCGRAVRKLPENFEEACQMWKRGEISAAEAARRCGMPVSTFRYHAKKKC